MNQPFYNNVNKIEEYKNKIKVIMNLMNFLKIF